MKPATSQGKKSRPFGSLKDLVSPRKDDTQDFIISPPTNARHTASLSVDLEWEGTGTFALKEQIGQGAFGKVYRGSMGKGSGMAVAIKSLPLPLNAEEDDLNAVRKEFDLIRKLRHENIVTSYGVSFRKRALWVIMELCEGGSVSDLMTSSKSALEEVDIAYFLKGLLQGLNYLHDQSIIHLDIKSGNILITKDLTVKIGDFGTATTKTFENNQQSGTVGTPLFMSPEVCRGDDYDLSTDIWSVGITAMEMAERKPPLSHLHVARAMHKIGSGEQRKTLKEPEKWNEPFRDFISLCLAEDPSKRPSPYELLAHPFMLTSFSQENSVGALVEAHQVTKRRNSTVLDVPPELKTRVTGPSSTNITAKGSLKTRKSDHSNVRTRARSRSSLETSHSHPIGPARPHRDGLLSSSDTTAAPDTSRARGITNSRRFTKMNSSRSTSRSPARGKPRQLFTKRSGSSLASNSEDLALQVQHLKAQLGREKKLRKEAESRARKAEYRASKYARMLGLHDEDHHHTKRAALSSSPTKQSRSSFLEPRRRHHHRHHRTRDKLPPSRSRSEKNVIAILDRDPLLCDSSPSTQDTLDAERVSPRPSVILKSVSSPRIKEMNRSSSGSSLSQESGDIAREVDKKMAEASEADSTPEGKTLRVKKRGDESTKISEGKDDNVVSKKGSSRLRKERKVKSRSPVKGSQTLRRNTTNERRAPRHSQLLSVGRPFVMDNGPLRSDADGEEALLDVRDDFEERRVASRTISSPSSAAVRAHARMLEQKRLDEAARVVEEALGGWEI